MSCLSSIPTSTVSISTLQSVQQVQESTTPADEVTSKSAESQLNLSLAGLIKIRNLITPHIGNNNHLDQIVTEYLDEHRLSYGTDYAKIAVTEQAAQLRSRGYTLFFHGMSLTHAYYQEILTCIERDSRSVNVEGRRPSYSFRVPHDHFPARSAELIAKHHLEINDSSDHFQTALLSVSLDCNLHAHAESADFYFSRARQYSEILHWDKLLGEEVANHILKKQVSESLLNRIFSARLEATKDLDVSGRLCMIAIPMNIIKSNQNIAYRCHAFGRPCGQYGTSAEGLEPDANGNFHKCNCDCLDNTIQARLTTRGLRLLMPRIEVYTYDSMDASQRRNYELCVQRAVDALNKAQRRLA